MHRTNIHYLDVSGADPERSYETTNGTLGIFVQGTPVLRALWGGRTKITSISGTGMELIPSEAFGLVTIVVVPNIS